MQAEVCGPAFRARAKLKRRSEPRDAGRYRSRRLTSASASRTRAAASPQASAPNDWEPGEVVKQTIVVFLPRHGELRGRLWLTPWKGAPRQAATEAIQFPLEQ